MKARRRGGEVKYNPQEDFSMPDKIWRSTNLLSATRKITVPKVS
jgi:hypothetical protein